ncbi:MAG: hypothetical protein PVF65_10065 [Sphingomonadales bacterium]|jgi:hypothetical protein
MKSLYAFALGLGFVALSSPSYAQTQIIFEGYVGERISALDAQEQRYEKRFRAYRHTDRNPARSTFRLNKARFFETEWAGERLIENIEDFTAEHLLQALVDYNLARVDDPIAPSKLRFVVDQLKTENNAVAIFDGSHSYMTGRMEVLGEGGAVVQSYDISANFVRQPSVERNYKGPDLFYFTTDPELRVGPLFTQFVAKGLNKLYPDIQFAKAYVAVDPVNF